MSGLSALMKSGAVLLLVFLLLNGPTSVLMQQMKSMGNMKSFYSGGWSLNERAKRSVGRVVLSDKDVKGAVEFAESNVGRLGRHEESLKRGGVGLTHGSSAHAAGLASSASGLGEDRAASKVAREGYVDVKAAVYLASRNCMRYGLSSDYCAEQMAKQLKSCDAKAKCLPTPYRSYDGSCNNQIDAKLGSTYTPYSRLLPPAYDDGFWEARGSMKRLPSPLVVSRKVVDGVKRETGVTMALVAWGNLVANDMAHTLANRMMNTGEAIMCCSQSGFSLAPRHRHTLCLPLTEAHSRCHNYVRSMLATPHKCQIGPAQQMNAATHFLDGSGVYGSTKESASRLRSFKAGLLKMDTKNGKSVLPRSEVENCHHRGSCYLSGEVRINMDMVSAGLHTVIVREHNRVAGALAALNPHWNDERLFQEARSIVVAEIQHITYREWLPLVLGSDEHSKHKYLQVPSSGRSQRVYNKKVDPSVLNGFANAAMKFIVSMVDEQIMLMSEEREVERSLLARDTSIRPDILEKKGTLDSLIRGLSAQPALAPDLAYPESVSKFYLSYGNSSGLDALAYDIQRGRDHGLPPYSEFRRLLGLKSETFDAFFDTIPSSVVYKLKNAYSNPASVDLLVGGLAEAPIEGSTGTGGGLLGPVFSDIVANQFVLSRVGDRFFYDNKQHPQPLSQGQIDEIKKSSMARLLCDNSDNVQMMQSQAFLRLDKKRNQLSMCSDFLSIPEVNLKLWQEG